MWVHAVDAPICMLKGGRREKPPRAPLVLHAPLAARRPAQRVKFAAESTCTPAADGGAAAPAAGPRCTAGCKANATARRGPPSRSRRRPRSAPPQSLQAAKLRDLLADVSDEKPYMTYTELLDFIKQQ
jgi:hypothetical protein